MSASADFDLIINHLGSFITDHKKNLVEEVLSHRTRYITLVLEDIYQSQNASAVFRTAECFGVQDIHLIENLNKYSLSRGVLKGANKWLNLIHHNSSDDNTASCFQQLKDGGYKILATAPNAVQSISDVDVSEKVALILGNELNGLSDYAKKHADIQVKIPMYGFTESLNLSVSAAIGVSELITKLRRSKIKWQLSLTERKELKLLWYRKLVRNSAIIEKSYLNSIK
ncbi:MAG TPA: RNA methyltransferase [Cyclobacteriaceae bacterium]